MRRARLLIRSVLHVAARVSACVALAAVLVALPVAVLLMVGAPQLSSGSLREVVRGPRVDEDAARAVAVVVFALLWGWFAVTAMHEAVHVRRWRVAPVAPLPALPAGPEGWIRRLVRVAVLTSMSAGISVGPSMAAAHASSASASPTVDTYVVQPGDCYWEIAEGRLEWVTAVSPTPAETLRYTEQLIEANHARLGHRDEALLLPGEVVVLPPVAGPTAATADPPIGPAPVLPAESAEPAEPATPRTPEQADVVRLPLDRAAPGWSTRPLDAAPAGAVSSPGEAPEGGAAVPAGPESSSAPRSPFGAGALATAALLSAGALAGLEARRRRRLRAAPIAARLRLPSLADTRTEMALRQVSAGERVARLDLALRAAAPMLAAHGSAVQAALVTADGSVALVLAEGPPPVAPWRRDEATGGWWLPASVDLVDLASAARQCPPPCPALVHVGTLGDGGEWYVDLESAGVLTVDSPDASHILAAIAASLDLSPLAADVRVITVGVDGDAGEGRVERVHALVDAVDVARRLTGSTAAVAAGRSTFALRAGGVAGDECEPVCIVATGPVDAAQLARLVEATGPGSAVAAVVAGRGGRWSLDAVDDGHLLQPIGVRLRPVGLDPEGLAAVRSLLGAEEAPLDLEADVVPLVAGDSVPVEPPWAFLVRTLGSVEVIDTAGEPVRFERSKSLELLVWMVHHHRPTRPAARTALWETDVRDATFANVVSEARRALARRTPPPEGTDWIGRTLTDALPLHRLVVSDATIIESRLSAAAGRSHEEAVAVLRPAVELVEGMPFAGTNYAWGDAEGISSSLVLLAVSAAAKLAGHCLALGDVEGVFWATGQGLKVLSGHEELIALRMRAYARSGDLAGVRGEWERYERVLAADAWADAEPSPKLLALRRSLLAPGGAAAAG